MNCCFEQALIRPRRSSWRRLDLVTARAAIRHAKHLNPQIDVIARAAVATEVELLQAAGADEVAQPEFEAGLELFVMCSSEMVFWMSSWTKSLVTSAQSSTVKLLRRRSLVLSRDDPRRPLFR